MYVMTLIRYTTVCKVFNNLFYLYGCIPRTPEDIALVTSILTKTYYCIVNITTMWLKTNKVCIIQKKKSSLKCLNQICHIKYQLLTWWLSAIILWKTRVSISKNLSCAENFRDIATRVPLYYTNVIICSKRVIVFFREWKTASPNTRPS